MFDFDGLILETELPVYESWRRVYEDHGAELPLDTWLETIGTADHEFDPFGHLQELAGRTLEVEPLQARRKLVRDGILHAQDLLPGVRDYIRDAQARGLRLGIASSSRRAWVLGHLRPPRAHRASLGRGQMRRRRRPHQARPRALPRGASCPQCRTRGRAGFRGLDERGGIAAKAAGAHGAWPSPAR